MTPADYEVLTLSPPEWEVWTQPPTTFDTLCQLRYLERDGDRYRLTSKGRIVVKAYKEFRVRTYIEQALEQRMFNKQDFGTWSAASSPMITLLPTPPKPPTPTPPAMRKKRQGLRSQAALGVVIPNYQPLFGVGDYVTLIVAGLSKHSTVRFEVVGISIVHPKNDGRWIDEECTTAQYTLRADLRYGGFMFIIRENEISTHLMRYEMNSVRHEQNTTTNAIQYLPSGKVAMPIALLPARTLTTAA